MIKIASKRGICQVYNNCIQYNELFIIFNLLNNVIIFNIIY